MQFEKAGLFIMDKMRRELPVQMVYHDINHTIDVCKAAERIGREEKLTEPELDLLLTAAHYHDCGYINGVKDHEEASCYMAKQYLPGFGYSPGDIEVICGMIRATQIPQSPQNILERILADADLDYLGRDDFFKIGNQLYSELAAMGILKTADEWNRLQESFLESHHYFTHTAIQSRQSKKQQNLLAVKAKLHNKGNRRGFHLPQPVADIIYTLVGILFCGFALKGFLVPNKYFDGGVTGISLLIHELYHFNIAYVIILANLPLIIMGGFQISVNFALRTFAAVVGLGLCLLLIPYPQITSDKLLVSIFGGIFMGIGVGLAMRGGCALDGIEVLAMYTGKRVSFTISEIILGINIIIFLVAAIKLGLPTALYSILTYYTASRTISFVIEGLEEYTGVTIISGQSALIKEQLVMSLSRGITIYKGERGFLKGSFDISHPVDIVFTVVTRLEVRRLRNLVQKIDPNAFVFTSTIKEASGGVLKRRARH